MQRLTLSPSSNLPPTRTHQSHPSSLPGAQVTKIHPRTPGAENGSIYFVGTATTILEWNGVRLMTDPNFLHKGDHVHLGPGVTAERKTNPAIDLEEVPRIDIVLLSHYHADHFDQKVEDELRRDLPIITTPHARECLVDKKEDEQKFTQVFGIDTFKSMLVDFDDVSKGENRKPAIKVTAMPGEHVPTGVLSSLNDILGAVPPTNGWMLELGTLSSTASASKEDTFQNGYRIYISGDTLMVDQLKEIPERYAGKNIDLMLVHLGGTTIPGPKMPLLMVTMDGKQGLQLLQLINPDVTIPIHFDDYDVFLSPLDDFKKQIEEHGLQDKVVYLDRGDKYAFRVKEGLSE